jgi:DNA-binding transcriptional MerR regulator
VDLISIGEFARRSGLSAKALRLYDELGLLPPARVDPDSGYRWYEVTQLEPARLVASLRQIGMPLAEIKIVLGLQPERGAEAIARYWAEVESGHATRRELTEYIIDRLNGKRAGMYEVEVRRIPARRILCLLRSVSGEAEVFSMGKEFVGLFRGSSVPSLKGIAGSAFLIYHGEVSQDSDGPIEWCRPVPDDRAHEIAAQFLNLTLRSEPEHNEAFVKLGSAQLTTAQWRLISDVLHTWGAEHEHTPSELDVRVTFTAPEPATATSRPDCDFAVPID